MTSNTSSAKSRTVALPKFNKDVLTGGKTAAKGHDVNAMVEAMWNGMTFAPYLVPLSRRVE